MSDNHKIKSKKINKYKSLYKIEYKNPTALHIVSQLFKKYQIDFIKKYAKDNDLDEENINKLINLYIKMNQYYPKVVQKKNREKLQLV